jgi:hypothetical protein
MKPFAGHFTDAFRLLFRRPPQMPGASLSPRAMLAVFLAMALLSVGAQWAEAGPDPRFSLYGANSILASLAALLAVIAIFSRRAPSDPTIRHLVLLLAGLTTWCAAASFLIAKLPAGGVKDYVSLGAFLISVVGSLLGARQAFSAVGAGRPLWRGVAFTLCSWGVLLALPNWPIFLKPDFKRDEANLGSRCEVSSRIGEAG